MGDDERGDEEIVVRGAREGGEPGMTSERSTSSRRTELAAFRKRKRFKGDVTKSLTIEWVRDRGERACRAFVEKTSVHVRHLVAGATASVVARTVLAPLERVKVELQINQQPGGALSNFGRILRSEGVLGLWKGNGLNLVRTVPYRSINYYTYDNTRHLMLRMSGKGELNNVQRLVAGATAGCVAITCCFPLDVLRTRMLSTGGSELYRKGLASTLIQVVRGEGVLALYSGVIPAIISVAPSNAVFYTVYDLLKTNHVRSARAERRSGSHGRRERGKPPLAAQPSPGRSREKEKKFGRSVKGSKKELGDPRPGSVGEKLAREEAAMDPRFNLLYGGLAGIAAETSVYPLEVIRRRLQLIQLGLLRTSATGAAEAPLREMVRAVGERAVRGVGKVQTFGNISSVRRLLAFILAKEGAKGLYVGILPTACQVLPSCAISYYIFEQTKKRLQVNK